MNKNGQWEPENKHIGISFSKFVFHSVSSSQSSRPGQKLALLSK